MNLFVKIGAGQPQKVCNTFKALFPGLFPVFMLVPPWMQHDDRRVSIRAAFDDSGRVDVINAELFFKGMFVPVGHRNYFMHCENRPPYEVFCCNGKKILTVKEQPRESCSESFQK